MEELCGLHRTKRETILPGWGRCLQNKIKFLFGKTFKSGSRSLPYPNSGTLSPPGLTESSQEIKDSLSRLLLFLEHKGFLCFHVSIWKPTSTKVIYHEVEGLQHGILHTLLGHLPGMIRSDALNQHREK